MSSPRTPEEALEAQEATARRTPSIVQLGRRMSKTYSRSIERRPLRTTAITAWLLGVAGDLLCQHYVEGSHTTDFARLVALSSFCACYEGPVCYKIYKAYDRVLPERWLLEKTTKGLAKSAVDNFVHVPIAYVPIFYFWVGLLQGQSVNEVIETLRREWWETTIACLVLWCPLQAINFTLVPARFNVLFVNVGCFFWNIYLSSRSRQNMSSA